MIDPIPAHWEGPRRIAELEATVARLEAKLVGVYAVLADHSPNGWDSAGYDLWEDVRSALDD